MHTEQARENIFHKMHSNCATPYHRKLIRGLKFTWSQEETGQKLIVENKIFFLGQELPNKLSESWKVIWGLNEIMFCPFSFCSWGTAFGHWRKPNAGLDRYLDHLGTALLVFSGAEREVMGGKREPRILENRFLHFYFFFWKPACWNCCQFTKWKISSVFLQDGLKE